MSTHKQTEVTVEVVPKPVPQEKSVPAVPASFLVKVDSQIAVVTVSTSAQIESTVVVAAKHARLEKFAQTVVVCSLVKQA